MRNLKIEYSELSLRLRFILEYKHQPIVQMEIWHNRLGK